MRRILLVLAAVTLVAACNTMPAAVPLPAPAQIETGLLSAANPPHRMTLAGRMRHHKVPGVSIAVIDMGRLAWVRAYGDTQAGGVPVTTATLFQAASISKLVVSAAALRLVEQRRLGLDDDVNRSLGAWQVPDNPYTAKRKVTLRGLLSHGAGTGVPGFQGYAQGLPLPTTKQVLDGLPPANSLRVRVESEPGSAWRYSGGGFMIVQQLLTDITGKPFASLMHETVLAPLGMDESDFIQPVPAGLIPHAARGHYASGDTVVGGWHNYPELAAAGLWTTPGDLALLVIDLNRAAMGQTGALLTPGTAREMLTPQHGGWGLGPALRGTGTSLCYSHEGGNVGYRAFIVGCPGTGQGVVVMTNGDAGDNLYSEIVRGIAAAYGWPQFQHGRIAESLVD
jgi:CubicO group peptidase (beta-lactamase class C family)